MNLRSDLQRRAVLDVAEDAFDRLGRTCATSVPIQKEVVLYDEKEGLDRVEIPPQAQISFFTKARKKNVHHFMITFLPEGGATESRLVFEHTPNSGSVTVKGAKSGRAAQGDRFSGAYHSISQFA